MVLSWRYSNLIDYPVLAPMPTLTLHDFLLPYLHLTPNITNRHIILFVHRLIRHCSKDLTQPVQLINTIIRDISKVTSVISPLEWEV